MKNGKNIFLKTSLRSIKDIFRYMPFSFLSVIIIGFLQAIASVLMLNEIETLYIEFNNYLLGESSFGALSSIIRFICYISFDMIGTQLIYRISNIGMVRGAEKFHDKISDFASQIPLEATEKPEIHDIFWKAKDAIYQGRMENIAKIVFSIIPNTFKLILIAIILARFSTYLIPVAVISVFPSLYIQFLVSKKEYTLHQDQVNKIRKRDYFWNILTTKESVREMQVMGYGEYILKENDILREEIHVAQKKLEMKSNLWTYISNVSQVVFFLIALIIVAYLSISDIISIPQFGACITAFITMQSAANLILSSGVRLKTMCNYADDYYAFLDIPSEKNGSVVMDTFSNCIELKGASFKYPTNDKEVLTDINLSIKKGERIAIVGENGSGKTTLSKIITGLYKSTSGNVFIDGVDYNDIDMKSIYEKITIISQNYLRYNLTLEDNICLNHEVSSVDISKMQLIIDELHMGNILSKTGGYKGELGLEFGGTELSGGEWQKIALGRCLFKDAEIALLDEPTSAFDPNIEYDILNQFVNIMRDKTAIIISHRVGICRLVDRIIVMKEGKIVEEGSHKDLLDLHGHYFTLWNEQAQWYI